MARNFDLRAELRGPSGAFWRVVVGAAALGLALTITWAFTPSTSFWPGWVWLGLAVPLAYERAVRRSLRSPRNKALNTHMALSAVTGVILVWIWLMTPERYFWPIWPLAALTVVLVIHGLVATARPPDRERQLEERVVDLTKSRTAVLDAQAAELRRLERDLHDGAQARLVALGMSLGLAEELLDEQPAEARRLLADARRSAAGALADLRDLVRGIHPPVLADRGLEEAVRAFALTVPVPVEVVWEPHGGRFAAPVESACYFAIAEAIANVAKHSQASRARLLAIYEGGRLALILSDDGCGGASLTPGGGLAGIERRLAAFDGTLDVSSPPGGPTIVTMELPCELSLPKT